MSQDLELKLRFTAENQGVSGVIRDTDRQVQKLTGSLDSAGQSGQGAAAGMTAVTTAGADANRVLDQQAPAVQQSSDRFDAYTAEVTESAGALDRVTTSAGKMRREVGGLDASLGGVLPPVKRTNRELSGITTAGQETTRMFRVQKGALQQAGYQFQDLAVQIGGGTSALVAIGQQGPQLLGTFGPGGALLGAVLAISTVVGGVFVSALGDGKDAITAMDAALQRLDDTIEVSDGVPELTRQIRELADVSEAAAKARIASALLAAEDAATSAAAGIADAFGDLPISDAFGLKDLEDFTESLGTFEAYLMAGYIQDELQELGELFGLGGDRAKQAGREIGELLTQLRANPSFENFQALESALGRFSMEGGKPDEVITRFIGSLSKYFDKARDAGEITKALENALTDLGGSLTSGGAGEIDRLIEKLRVQAETLGKTSLDLIEYNRQSDLATARDAAVAAEKIGLINTYYDQIAQHEKAAIATKKEREEQEALARVQREYTKSVQGLINEMDPLGREFESVYEKQQLLIQAAANGDISEAQRDTWITQLVEDMAKGGDEYDQWLNRLKGSIDPLQQVEKEITKIWGAFTAGDLEGFDKAQIKAFTDAMRKGVQKGGDELEKEFSQASNRVASTLQDAIATGDWQGVGTTIGGVLAGSVGGMVADQLTQQMAGQAGASIFGPVAGAIAGGVVGAAVSAISDYFRDDLDPTEDRQAAQGTGTVLGSIEAKSESIAAATDLTASATSDLVSINQGMLRALERVQLGIDGATAMIARGLDDVSFDVALGSHLSKSQQQGVGLMAAAGGTLGGLGAAGLVGSLGVSFPPALLLGALGAAGALDPVLDIADTLTLGLLGKIGKAIGGKTKQIDEGIRIMGGKIGAMADEMLVEAFVTYKTKKHALDDYDTHERFEALDDEVTRQFELVMGDIYDSVSAGAEALGILPADVKTRLDEFVLKTQRISLEGLDDAEQQAEIQAVFSTIFDDLAETAVPFLEELQKAGEGPGETLARVATELGLIQEMATLLNTELQAQTPRDSSIAASEFSALMGGSEALAGAISGLETNFLTEVEQFEALSRRLGSALGELPLPETRDAYLEQIRVLIQGDEAAQAHAATYLKLQGVADRYYAHLEATAEATAQTAQDQLADLLALTDTAFSDLQASISSRRETLSEQYQEEQALIRAEMDARLQANRLALTAAQRGLQAIRQEIQGIESAADSLAGAYEPIQDIRRFDAVQTLREALASGDLTGAGEAASFVSDVDAKRFANRVDYEREQGQSLALLEALEAEGGAQLTAAEQSVAALQRQTEVIRRQGDDALDQAEQAYEDEMDALDQILTGAEQEINALRGIETGVLSIVSAIEALAAAMGKEILGQDDDTPMDTVEQLYRTLLGREIGQEGRDYWSGVLANGGSLADIEWSIRQSPEFKNRLNIPGFAAGGDHTGGWRVVGEVGPELEYTGPSRIYSNTQSRDLLDLSPVVTAIHQLERRLERIEAYERAISSNTGKTANYQVRFDRNGLKIREPSV